MNLSSVLSSFIHLSNIIEHLLESYLEDLLTLAKIKRRSNEDQMNIKWTSNEHQMNIKWNPKMKIKWRYVPVRTSKQGNGLIETHSKTILRLMTVPMEWWMHRIWQLWRPRTISQFLLRFVWDNPTLSGDTDWMLLLMGDQYTLTDILRRSSTSRQALTMSEN